MNNEYFEQAQQIINSNLTAKEKYKQLSAIEDKLLEMNIEEEQQMIADVFTSWMMNTLSDSERDAINLGEWDSE